LTKVSEEINQSRSNWTLNEFRNEVDRIKSEEISKQEISELVNDQTQNQPDSTRKRLTENIQNKINKEQIKEVSLIHFLPALIVNFGLYYFINAFVVFIYREFRD